MFEIFGYSFEEVVYFGRNSCVGALTLENGRGAVTVSVAAT